MRRTVMTKQLELKKVQDKPHQSWGEVIQFLDGFCFGIAPDGRTICLGKEAEIKEMLADPTKRSINPLANDIIDLERELIKQKESEDGRQPNLKKAGAFRSRPAGNFQRRETNARRSSAGKRAAVHKA
ncbi:hypothetical protein ACFLV6_01875 [Chloroflexota bacterium]